MFVPSDIGIEITLGKLDWSHILNPIANGELDQLH